MYQVINADGTDRFGRRGVRLARALACVVIIAGCGGSTARATVVSTVNTTVVAVASDSATAPSPSAVASAATTVPTMPTTVKVFVDSAERASSALETVYPDCELAPVTADAPEPDDAPLVDGKIDRVAFAPDVTPQRTACVTGATIINVLVFSSAGDRERAVAYLGEVERPRMKSLGITEIVLAWADDAPWLAWVEKVDQPMPSPSIGILMSANDVAEALGGTATRLSI